MAGAWEDCGLGVCACGQERRVYRPLDSAKTPVCSECATRHRLRNIVDLPPSVVDPEEQDELRGLREGGAGPARRPFLTTWPGVLVLVFAALLLVGFVGLGGVGVVWWRKLGRLAVYQRPYAQLVQLGRWFGVVRPAPSDTPYELASALSRQLPGARPTVDHLTSAYVESTYANRPPAANPWPEWLSARRRLIRELAIRRFRRLFKP